MVDIPVSPLTTAAPAAPKSRWVNRLIVRLLRSDLRPLLEHTTGVVRYTSRTGAQIVLPVQVARGSDRIVVLAGHAETKRWWRHFLASAPAQVWLGGRWHDGTGRVVRGLDTGAAHIYRQAFPRARIGVAPVFVEIAVAEPLPPRDALRGRELERAWFWTVTAAETVGFAVPACAGAAMAGASPAVSLAALVAAGAAEGALLGAGQAVVLRQALPGLPARAWIGVTAAAAALAYLIGLIPSTAGPALAAVPRPALVPAAAVLGTALLASIGTAQWLVLRRHAPRAATWIATTAAAWSVGLAAFLGFAMPLWQPGQAIGAVVAIGVGGGLLMAVTTSAITGHALRRLLR
ncbi:MAG: hypothetical protein QOI35_2051 [Cryptosporangiaceae bacterium]|nr:hypothetical protein [Cryptosporangiaceae bacterium]